MHHDIPQDIIRRIPLFKPEWADMLARLGTHVHAPRWNAVCGDRLTTEDMVEVVQFAGRIESRTPSSGYPSDEMLEWILGMKKRSLWFNEKCAGKKITGNFSGIPVMKKRDLLMNLERITPFDQDLSRLIVNPTSGTTGQVFRAPSHPVMQASYDPLIQFALRRHGVSTAYDYTTVAALQLCAQHTTITYYTVHSYLNGAGFAKVNLNPGDWPEPDSPAHYVEDMAPLFFSGDPYAYSVAMNTGIRFHPRALLSTAMAMGANLKTRLAEHFGAPVVELYSLNESGPLGYACPAVPGKYHVLPTDVFLECVDEDDEPAAPGETGRLLVTGGRNPYLPLLRYDTGDTARMDFSACACGDPHPGFRLAQTRRPVVFFTAAGKAVNPVDISRLLRRHPVGMHHFEQGPDHACTLSLSALSPLSASALETIRLEILGLFDDSVELSVDTGYSAAESKVQPFICRIPNEL